MSIAIGIAGSDLSTLLVCLSPYDEAKFGPLRPSESRGEPVFMLQCFDVSEGATEAYERHADYIVFARGRNEAIRLFMEATGGTHVPVEAFEERERA